MSLAPFICTTDPSISKLAFLCIQGGWPALQRFSSADAQEVVRSYLADIFAQSVLRMGRD